MQALLPKVAGRSKSSSGSSKGGGDNDDEEEEKDSPANTPEGKSANSKAATVEGAIDYIRLLQRERMQTVEMLKAKDDEMTMLREKLQAAELKASGPEDGETVEAGE